MATPLPDKKTSSKYNSEMAKREAEKRRLSLDRLGQFLGLRIVMDHKPAKKGR
ncbi:MAG: hypothetical protein VX988_12105 [Planctomycetota bacterium]|nr:hypothetical protein [Planctomycetota bacterium]